MRKKLLALVAFGWLLAGCEKPVATHTQEYWCENKKDAWALLKQCSESDANPDCAVAKKAVMTCPDDAAAPRF